MAEFTLAGVRRGAAAALSSAAPGAVAFGIGFGAVAAAKGVGPPEAIAMSALVFSRAAQFAALGSLFPYQFVIAMALMTLMIGARYVFLGATLRGHLCQAPRAARILSLAFLSEASWASTSKAVASGERDLGHLLGGGLLLWAAWLAGTAIGLGLGSALGNEERFGLDVIVPAFFILCLMELSPGGQKAVPPAVAATASAVLVAFAPSYVAILAGALVGATVGAWRDRHG